MVEKIPSPTYNQYLKYPYISPSIDGPSGISCSTILEIFDTECKILWKKTDQDFTDPIGMSILRYAIDEKFYSEIKFICKNFYQNFDCNQTQIILQPTIEIIKFFLNDSCINYQEIDVPVYDFGENVISRCKINYYELNKIIKENSTKGFYSLIDHVSDYDFDYRLIDFENLKYLIFIGSFQNFYGIKSIPISWLYIVDKDFYADFYNKIRNFQNSLSFHSEILALATLKIHDKILQANFTVRELNLEILEVFFNRNKDKFYWHPPKKSFIGYVGLKDNQNINDFISEILERSKILLTKSRLFPDKIALCVGQANLKSAINAWEDHFISYEKCR